MDSWGRMAARADALWRKAREQGSVSWTRDGLRELVHPLRHPAVLSRQRARLILARVRVVAMLFAVLTVLWIPVDAWLFPPALWRQLAWARIGAASAFAVLAWACRASPTPGNGFKAMLGLFIIPVAFYLAAEMIIARAHLGSHSAGLADVYALSPLLFIAGISIFPLTVAESVSLALPVLAALLILRALRAMAGHPLMPNAAVASIWLLVVLAAVSLMAAGSQLHMLYALAGRAAIDPMTGLTSRSSGEELLRLQFTLSQRHDYPLTIAFLDIDDFKAINDRAGHEAGDALLSAAGQVLRRGLREGDAAIRWGGDEFLLVFPYARENEIKRRLGETLSSAGLRRSDGAPLTFSVGVASLPRDLASDAADLVRLADQRMYEAKLEGKNRLVT